MMALAFALTATVKVPLGSRSTVVASTHFPLSSLSIRGFDDRARDTGERRPDAVDERLGRLVEGEHADREERRAQAEDVARV